MSTINKPCDFTTMVECLKDAFQQAVVVKTSIDYVNWKGISGFVLNNPVCVQPEKKLSREGLRLNREQNRDVLDVLIGIALEMGIEQGKRIVQNSPEYKAMMIINSLQNNNIS